jgi:very-short-patch-repair endonuclease
MLQGAAPTIRHARALRREMSLPERLLWRRLRSRPAGLKFRRQHPAGPYVADFFCHDARLVVEVDGETHAHGDRPARDLRRDAWFAERGFAVMRITAADVLNDPDAVLLAIVARAGRDAGAPHDGDRPNGFRAPDELARPRPAATPTPLRRALPGTSPLGGGLVLE